MSIITGNPRRHGARPSQSESYLRSKEAKRTASAPAASRHEAAPVARSPTPAAASHQDPFDQPGSKSGKKAKKRKKALTPAEKRKRYLKWAFWILVAVALYFSFDWLSGQLLHLLQQNPTVWSLYLAVEAEIESKSLLGLFYAAFFGALFFVALPVELIFIYYLGLNYYFVQVLTITLLGNLLGITLDYFIGWLIGPKVLQWFMKAETYHAFQRKIDKAGIFIVIVGNIIPFPIEPLTVFLGAVRYGYFRLMLFTAIGKLVKFGLLWLGYKYFVQYVGPYISTVNLPWFIDLVKSGFGG